MSLPVLNRKQHPVLKTAVRPHANAQTWIGATFIPIVILGWYWPWIGLSILACMLAGMIIAIKRGRQWCDYWCPRGSFLDAFAMKISPQKNVPQWFYSYKFRLTFITGLFSFLLFNVYTAWPNWEGVGFAFVKTLTITTVLSIILTYFWRARAWCITCPVGTFSGLIGKGKHLLKVDKETCINCTKCAIVCPMNLSPYKDKTFGTLQSADCIKCGTCVANCPVKALSF